MKGVAYDSDSDDENGTDDDCEDGGGVSRRRIVVSGAGGTRAINRAMKKTPPRHVPLAFSNAMTQDDKCKACRVSVNGAM